jgi:hypothetical protein
MPAHPYSFDLRLKLPTASQLHVLTGGRSGSFDDDRIN